MNPQYPQPQWQQATILPPGYAPPPIYPQNSNHPYPTTTTMHPPQFMPCPSNYYLNDHQERERLMKNVEQLEKDKSQMAKEIEKLKLNYEELSNEKDSQIRKIHKDMDARLGEIEKVKRETEERLTRRIRDLSSENERLERELEEIECDYKGLEVRNAKLHKDNEKLVHDGFKDDEEISTLQGQLRELYDENVKLKEMLEANRREMERIRQEYRESQEKTKRYKKRCSLCEEDLRKSQHILDKKEARIEELQKQLNEAMQTRGELKKELDATKTKCLIAEKQAKYAEEELRRKMGTATVTAPATATTAARGK